MPTPIENLFWLRKRGRLDGVLKKQPIAEVFRLFQETKEAERKALLEDGKSFEEISSLAQILKDEIESRAQEVVDEISIDEDKFKPLSVTDILAEDLSPVEWIVENLIPEEGIVALSGVPGSYKSWISYHLAVCVAKGVPLFGQFQTKQNRVLIIDEENSPRLAHQRLLKLEVGETPIYFLFMKGIKIDTRNDLEGLINLSNNLEIGLIIFDSLIRMHTKDENDAVAMARIAEALKEFTKSGMSVLFTHHHRKQSPFGGKNLSQSLRGSSEILAFVDCHLAVEKTEEHLIISQTKLRQAEELRPFKVGIRDEDDKVIFEYLGEHDEVKKKIEEAKILIVDYISEHDGATRQEMIQALGAQVGERTLSEALRSLENKEEIRSLRGSHGKKTYYLPEQLEEKSLGFENKP